MGSIMSPSNMPPHSENIPYSFSETAQGSSRPTEHAFYPYTDNGGSTLGIAGASYAILAGDTRSTTGYSIQTRYFPKLYPIPSDSPNPHLVLSLVGYQADGLALRDRLSTIVKMYKHQHNKPMSVRACAQRLSTILYSKRFFPYYVTAILAGIDAETGAGALYSYDPVGSYEREQCRAAGAAASLIMPFLDNQVNFKNQYVPGSGKEGDALTLEERPREPLDLQTAEQLVKDAFTSVTERHIEVGDGLQIIVLTKDGLREEFVPLKRD